MAGYLQFWLIGDKLEFSPKKARPFADLNALQDSLKLKFRMPI